MKQLYFISVLPPHLLAEKIHSIKEEIAVKYDCRHSLKIPEHITLIPPFHCSDELLDTIIAHLKILCHAIKSFEVHFTDFGHFSKSVLYIQASSQPKDALEALHDSLKSVFSTELSSINFPQSGEKFTPHLTIANKDLTKNNFKQAWEELKGRPFKENFPVYSIAMMKHIDGLWKKETEIFFKD